MDYRQMRRRFDAAVKDKKPHVFVNELKEGLDSKAIRPDEFSIRGLFESLIPDGREVVDSWNPRYGGHGAHPFSTIWEADAVHSSAFANITGQIVYSATLEGFMNEEFVFSKLIPTIQATTLEGEKIAGVAGLGDSAAIVAELRSFPYVGLTEDWVQTPASVKRGDIVALSRESVWSDRTGQVVQRARENGKYMGLNKEKRAIDCVIDENTTAHRYNWRGTVIATYGDNSGTHSWDNLSASTALVDWTDVDAADQLFNGITDPNTGEPVMVVPNALICAKGLEQVALRIRNATEITVVTAGFATSGNPTQTRQSNPYGGKFDVYSTRLIAPRLATDTSWFYGDPTKAFAYMEVFPMSEVTLAGNSILEFERDIVLATRVSERGAYATLQPRYMVTATA